MWKTISGTDGKYSVSDRGEVRNNKTSRILKPVATYNGYLRVPINKRLCRIHILVANAFIGEKGDGYQINHKDGNKKNNAVENLEWCTARENILHAYKNGLKEVCFDNIKKPRPVRQLSVDGELIKEYNSIKDAERETGFDNSGIAKACKGKQKTAYGYIWRYASL